MDVSEPESQMVGLSSLHGFKALWVILMHRECRLSFNRAENTSKWTTSSTLEE